MDKKTLKTYFCMLIILCLFLSCISININGKYNENNLYHCTSFNDYDAELPIWNIGDKWIYNIDVDGGFESDVYFDLSIKNMKLEVINVQDDRYILDLSVPKGDLYGNVNVNLEIINIQGSLINTEITGSLNISNQNLEIIDAEGVINGFIDKIVDIPININFNIYFKNSTLNITKFKSLNFPFDIGDTWHIPFTYSFVNFLVNLLPNQQNIPLQADEHEFICLKWETISIDDNDYDVLNISGNLGSQQNIWYSVSSGNIIKTNFKNIYIGYGYILNNFKMELISTNYHITSNPPDIPITISGPDTLLVGIKGEFETSTIDSDGDKIKYVFDWDDGTKTTTDFYGSGIPITTPHEWNTDGNYSIKVKARDKYGAESGFSSVKNVLIYNNAPEKPARPDGPANGKLKTSYTYNTTSIDEDGHKIRYGFDWDGDDVVDFWTDFYESGETASPSHTWYEQGEYQIKVKAIDEYGKESPWSDPLPIIMPKKKSFNYIPWIFRLIQRFPILNLLI